jgi:DNA-binding NarL/FixJ family response regulator
VDEAAGALVDRARVALRAGDGAAAREAIGPLAGDPGRGDVIEILARADYLDLKYMSAIEQWERAYRAYRAAGDRSGAVRVARTLAGLYGTIVGDFAICGGWLARAETLLDTPGDTPEHGWIMLNAGMFEPDRAEKNTRFREALSIARASGDTALEVAALAYLGASMVHGDQVSEGMRLLDEALAAVAGDEVDDFSVLEEVFCQLFAACEYARDVARADQWIRVGESIAARRNLPAVSAFCRTHYGGVLTIAGRWPEADDALSEAVRLWGLGQRSVLRGGALVRLADLRVRQGRVDEAEALLAEVDERVFDESAHARAAICLARGETAVAREILEAALTDVSPTAAEAAPLLELLVEVNVADGDMVGATAALDLLLGTAERNRSDYLVALAALARGRVCLGWADHDDPLPCLREAVRGFARAGVPLEAALAQLMLAQALGAERRDAAVAEARSALDAFERLQAARHADAAVALLRSLGVRPSTGRSGNAGGLTKREAEVLDLIGHGLSNPEIAQRLYISRKTVEHHVSNLLAKLGLRTRGEAAAYAVRQAGTATGGSAPE